MKDFKQKLDFKKLISCGILSLVVALPALSQQHVQQNLTINSNGINSTEILFKKQDNIAYYDLIANFSHFALWNSNSGKHVMFFDANDRFGLGTTNPLAKAHIKSDEIQLRLQPEGYSNSNSSRFGILDLWGTFDQYPNDQGPRRSATIKGGFSGGTWGSEVLTFSVGRGGTNDASYEPLERMRINGAGNVGIGTMSPQEKLSVNGKIRAHEVKVETANWPDYVFEDGYQVNSLLDLENYVRKYKHLPEIPSAREIEQSGVELGVMNKLLLKKVEELTLHLIQKEKELGLERKRIDVLALKLENIEKLIGVSKKNKQTCYEN